MRTSCSEPAAFRLIGGYSQGCRLVQKRKSFITARSGLSRISISRLNIKPRTPRIPHSVDQPSTRTIPAERPETRWRQRQPRQIVGFFSSPRGPYRRRLFPAPTRRAGLAQGSVSILEGHPRSRTASASARNCETVVARVHDRVRCRSASFSGARWPHFLSPPPVEDSHMKPSRRRTKCPRSLSIRLSLLVKLF